MSTATAVTTILKEHYAQLRRLRRVEGRKPVIYTAGPFRPLNDDGHWGIRQNIRRAERHALSIWRAGAVAICPHLNTANYQGAAPDELWLDGDFELLMACDAVYMLPEWRKSQGSLAELEFAKEWGIPVFCDLNDLYQHFGLRGEEAA